jgi:hypothetical protein
MRRMVLQKKHWINIGLPVIGVLDNLSQKYHNQGILVV